MKTQATPKATQTKVATPKVAKTATKATVKKTDAKQTNVIKVIRQASHHEVKGEKLIMQSIKMLANKKTRVDEVILNLRDVRAIVKKIKKNDVEAFRAAFYSLARKDKMKIDGQSEKLGLCKHARARQHVFNVIAEVCEREDLIINYGKEAVKA